MVKNTKDFIMDNDYREFNKAKNELEAIQESKVALHNKLFARLICGSESNMESPQLDMIVPYIDDNPEMSMSIQHFLEDVDEKNIDDYIEEHLFKFAALLDYKERLAKKTFNRYFNK